MRLSVATIAVALFAAACSSATTAGTSKVDLAPHTKLPLYRVAVEDPDEASLITQRYKFIAPVLVESHTMYFRDSAGAVSLLRDLGYDPKRVAAEDFETRIVRVPVHGTEAELLATGVRLINREKEYWVVSGTLAQLRLLPRLGYTVDPMGDDPRPRPVRVTVATTADVQNVNAMGVDIYSVGRLAGPNGAIVITGGAFDAQIDALAKWGYEVERLPAAQPK